MDHLSHIRRESEEFLATALDGSLDTPVSACPGWTVADLVGHLGVVQRFHGSHILRGVTDPPPGPRPDPPASGLADWFSEGTVQLLDNLATVGFDTPAWNWSIRPQDATTRFWHRRMACEAAIHRWDVQHARRRATGFDRDLALDGIDEVLAMQIPSKRTGGEPEGTVTVHVIDGDHPQQLITGDPAASSATIRGSADDVWLALWGRLPLSDLEVEGDLALAASAVTG